MSFLFWTRNCWNIWKRLFRVWGLYVLMYIVENVMVWAKLFQFVLDVIFIIIWYLVKNVFEQDMYRKRESLNIMNR